MAATRTGRATSVLLLLLAAVAVKGRKVLQDEPAFERLDGKGCNGLKLRTEEAGDRGECERRCDADSACLAYSFNKNDQKCFLKRTPCLSKDDNENNDSGVRSGASSEWRAFTQLGGVGCDGGDEDRATLEGCGEGGDKSASECRAMCQDACADAEMCLGYSYNVQNGRCFLKSGVCEDAHSNPDNLSGVRTILYELYQGADAEAEVAAFATVTADEVVEEVVAWVSLPATGCNGADVDEVDDTTEEDCQKACGLRADCKAYSFNLTDKKCYLKEKECTEEQRDANENNNSGMKP